MAPTLPSAARSMPVQGILLLLLLLLLLSLDAPPVRRWGAGRVPARLAARTAAHGSAARPAGGPAPARFDTAPPGECVWVWMWVHACVSRGTATYYYH